MTDMRRRQAVETWLQEPYLDAEEQEQVIVSLKEEQAHMFRQWTTVFAAIATVLGAGCLYCSWRQLIDPWGLKHHAFFYGAAGLVTVALGESCSAVSLLLSAGALITKNRRTNNNPNQPNRQSTLLFSAAAIALVTAVFWSYALYKAKHYQDVTFIHSLRYAWMPCTPFLYSLLVRYLLHSFHNIAHDIAALRGSMYNLHSA